MNNIWSNLRSNGLLVKVLDPNPGVPCLEPLGCSKVGSAFHTCEVDKMSTRNFWERNDKSKLPPRSGSSLEAVEPHP